MDCLLLQLRVFYAVTADIVIVDVVVVVLVLVVVIVVVATF